ncbi:2-dehydropantoate 2-reductase (Ketopantoate reductase) (KPA reductase) (KPR) [Coemansia sp. RSA 1804]|nr:2-dehydropantoate 2-reductase (Ketopantoate reductase) (KPA reductase) (KPR) [Coemansia sp. RSA 1804]
MESSKERRGLPTRVHVLGAGAVGLLIAAHLRRVGHPVTLLLRTQASVDRFVSDGKRVVVHSDWMGAQSAEKVWVADGICAEHPQTTSASSTGSACARIRRLVITTKAHDTVKAYMSVENRLDAQSTVLLLQNGMGTYEAIQHRQRASDQDRKKEVRMKEGEPSFVIGTNSHGCLRIPGEKFATHHTAIGDLKFAVREPLHKRTIQAPKTTDEMLNAVQNLGLNASVVGWTELHKQLLLKLAANAVINPVTALAGCRNGYVVPQQQGGGGSEHHVSTASMVSSACAEIAAVYARAYPQLGKELSAQTLERHAVAVARATGANRSSMLQDVSAGEATEVDWINGYLMRLGEQHGVATPVNTLLHTVVKLKEEAAATAADVEILAQE